jgi:beta-galactosidase
LIQFPRQRIDLAGQWDLAFDDDDVGVQNGWPAGGWPAAASAVIHVPALWTVTHPQRTGIGFYRRRISVARDWDGQVVRLCVGGASYRLDAWVNGVYAGSHEGAYTPFWLDVTRAVRAGSSNEVVLRVASLSKTEAVDGLLLQRCPASKQSWYYIEAGVWGDVYLETLPPCWCEAASIFPDLRGQGIDVEVDLRNALPHPSAAELQLAVTDPSGRAVAEMASSLSLLPGSTRHSFNIHIERPDAWSCEHPALYRLQVALAARGSRPDGVAETFGMRDFTVNNGQFFLNDQPIYLRGILLQPNYPATLIVPPEPEMMRREVELAKGAGFNLIRTHIRPSPPGFLDLCDEMGMLVYAEACMAWIRPGPRLLDHGRREMAAMIERDRNHPSVVFWGVYNENRLASALTGRELALFTRALDPTRWRLTRISPG